MDGFEMLGHLERVRLSRSAAHVTVLEVEVLRLLVRLEVARI